jgi:hypothetical protein
VSEQNFQYVTKIESKCWCDVENLTIKSKNPFLFTTLWCMAKLGGSQAVDAWHLWADVWILALNYFFVIHDNNGQADFEQFRNCVTKFLVREFRLLMSIDCPQYPRTINILSQLRRYLNCVHVSVQVCNIFLACPGFLSLIQKFAVSRLQNFLNPQRCCRDSVMKWAGSSALYL